MPDYVEAILGAVVLVECSAQTHHPALRAMGASASSERPSQWKIPYASPNALAATLGVLRDIGLPFLAQPGGWPPAAVFSLLKEQGLLSGSVQTISWQSPTEFHVSVAGA